MALFYRSFLILLALSLPPHVTCILRGVQSTRNLQGFGTDGRIRGNGRGGAGSAITMNNLPPMKTPLDDDGGTTTTAPPSSSCPTTTYTDIVIVGAGASGIAAAARLHAVDSSLDVKILESTDRIGGRVRSKRFGVPDNQYVVEEGAQWLWDNSDNPVLTMANDFNLEYAQDNKRDWVVYDAQTGALIDPDNVLDVLASLEHAWEGSLEDTNAYYAITGSLPDPGILQLLEDNGFHVLPVDQALENLKYSLQWTYLDQQFTTSESLSVLSMKHVDSDQLIVFDTRGFDSMIQQYYIDNVQPGTLVANARVTEIDYNVSRQHNGKDYKARVTADTPSGCVDYYALRTILTVPVGVIEAEDLITMSPELSYPISTHFPFSYGQFIKVYYQFSSQFWDDTHHLMAVQKLSNRGKCQQWLNLNHKDFLKGSNIVVCFLMTDAFEEIINTEGFLSLFALISLLDPLRAAYGADFQEPIAFDYTTLNQDADFGFGALAFWKQGRTLRDYLSFYGGFPTLTAPCDHNGCNADNEWILHFGGACSCLEHWETLQGAVWGGERSANWVLYSLGYDVDTSSSQCNGRFD